MSAIWQHIFISMFDIPQFRSKDDLPMQFTRQVHKNKQYDIKSIVKPKHVKAIHKTKIKSRLNRTAENDT